MSGLITKTKNICKRMLSQKGQGLVEFVLILAFCAGIGVAAREAGFAEAISNLLDSGEQTEDVAAAIGGPLSAERLTYGKYLAKWGKYTAEELAAIRNEERITGDQKGLVAIASNFLGKNASEVLAQMKVFTNNAATFAGNSINQNYTKAQSDGWSKELVPLSYKNVNKQDKDTTGYIWIEANNNTNTIDAMTGDDAKAEYYKKPSSDATSKAGVVLKDSKTKTVSVDRIFYSDEMIAADDRAVVLQVHYNSETNTVDQVRIVARLGDGTQSTKNPPAAAAAGLDLTVTGSTSDVRYIVNN